MTNTKNLIADEDADLIDSDFIDSKSAQALGAGGAIADYIDGFAPRPDQQRMALAVESSIDAKSVLVAEAGTGTGKTFAYLIPILLSGKKTVVSTGTKNLQDQLYHRDLPTVKKALGLNLKTALLKGRSNYLCPYRLEVHLEDGRFQSREVVHHLQVVATWAKITVAGDIAELSEIPENAQVWPFVTSSPDNCLGQDCPCIEDCPVLKVRRKAMEADLVVVNHHLFFADAALKEEGFGELLPGVEAIVFDEAHQLPDVAAMFFGLSVGSRQVIDLCRDTTNEVIQHAKELGDLKDLAAGVEKSVRDARLSFGEETQKSPWKKVEHDQSIAEALGSVVEKLKNFTEQLKLASVRSKGLDNCFTRSEDITQRFEMLAGASPNDQVHWFETYKKSFSLNFTPLSIAERFQEFVAGKECAWVFTSATLAMGSDFSHFTDDLGFVSAKTLQFESPFNYPEQSMLYVPRGMPDPSQFGFSDAVVEAAIPVLKASRGRAFFLFTSHRALQRSAEILEEQLDCSLLVQGEMGKNELLNQFRQLDNAVLLGTSSFWEGVDVRGDALSCVIIDKLPFSSPGEPVVQARIDAMRRQGKNPFNDFQLPRAVITLKQGAGRLIRDVEDSGVLMVCDPRLVAKNYGAQFVQSLPKMRRTRRLDLVEQFFENEDVFENGKGQGHEEG
ncbi:MAG: ATP-dependent DNA helicase [Pseudomonadales bacterium]|nr:ATP-dependent DNA helicase [Pseudomonadales bacterium]